MVRKKFAVIGAGNVSGTYLYTLNSNPNVEIASVVDTNLKKVFEQANLFGIKKVYSNYKDAIRERLDAVVVCTPHYLHHDQVVECSKKGLDILCEKPLATSLEDIEDMVEKCSDVRFGVMLQRRFYPNTQQTREAVVNEYLGNVEEVSLSFKCHKSKEFYNDWRGKSISGGGVLISQALHRIDQLVYIFGKPVGVEGITKKTRDYIEVEDYAKGRVFFENGVTAEIEADNSSGNPDTISIIEIKGTKGRIVMSDDKTTDWNVKFLPKPKEIDINQVPLEYRPAYYGPCHEMVINDFVNSIVEKRQPSIQGSDSLDSMKIIFGLYKSAKINGERINLN